MWYAQRHYSSLVLVIVLVIAVVVIINSILH